MSCQKKECYLPLHEMRIYSVSPTQKYRTKILLKYKSVKIPVISRANPPYLKCIYMVEKYANIRGVNPFLTIKCKCGGWTIDVKGGAS